MLISLLKYKKPSFAYLYTIFGVFLTVLVVLSLLFSQRLNSLIRYSDDADHVYSIVFQFGKLENLVKDVETTGRGFMITRDSSFLSQMEEFNSGIQPVLDSLKKLLKDDVLLSDRLTRISRIVRKRIILQKLNIQKVALNDTFGLAASLNVGEYYMSQFRDEIRILEKDGVKKSAQLDKDKKTYEKIIPGLFTWILAFSGIVSLLSFFYIIREIKIRLKYQKELERRLLELNRSYAELEQFTFVASHDLQEPLRKIRTFSDRLLSKYNPQLETKAKDIIARMDVAAGRLQELIHDITNFSALINKEEISGTVDLNEVVKGVLSEFDSAIQQVNMSVFLDSLPVITGYRKQLSLLFTALIDNAIKFSKTSDTPILKIRYDFLEKGNTAGSTKLTQDYHKISVEDNGIGFDNEFAEKIFIIFQRLHTQQSKYHGKGIGLAIAQRVMVNHSGFILTKSSPQEGAEFSLYFPAKPD
ncbi:MAG TPA: ATP-binding protein [Flavitalea sp.]|nr:ATP-binding protein [Flavitalea sp.]